MSAKYIPNKTPIVCTYQTTPAPSELIVTRSAITVMYKTKEEPLLTVQDKNIQMEFTCKLDAGGWRSMMAFGAGLIVGAALILSGPVGWAVIAVGAGIMAAGYVASKVVHKCTPHLEAGTWALNHSTVKLDGAPALTQMSILTCSRSGILKPIIDPALALSAAQSISNNNKWEIRANMAISFFFGFGLVTTGAAAASAVTTASAAGATTFGAALAGGGVVGKMTLLTVIGSPLISIATTAEQQIIRDNSLEDSESYQNLNDVEGLSYTPQWISDIDTLDPSDPENLGDAISPQKFAEIVALREKLNKIRAELKALEGTQDTNRSRQQRRALQRELAKTDQDLKRTLAEINKNQKNPKKTKKTLSNDKVKDIMKNKRAAAAAIAPKTNRLTAAKGIESLSVISLILPFVATWFTESARKDLAIAADLDLVRATGTIITQQPI